MLRLILGHVLLATTLIGANVLKANVDFDLRPPVHSLR
jgi:hypothetical protein